MSTRVAGLLDGVDYHQIYLVATDRDDHFPEYPQDGRTVNDLLIPTNDAVCIATGIAMGVIDMTVELLDGEPPRLDTSRSWEVVNDVSFRATSADAYVMTLMSGPAEAPFDRLPLPGGPGWYRVRGHATGRSIAYDDVVTDDPQEHHLPQLWKSPGPSDPVDHLVDDQWAQQEP